MVMVYSIIKEDGVGGRDGRGMTLAYSTVKGGGVSKGSGMVIL